MKKETFFIYERVGKDIFEREVTIQGNKISRKKRVKIAKYDKDLL